MFHHNSETCGAALTKRHTHMTYDPGTNTAGMTLLVPLRVGRESGRYVKVLKMVDICVKPIVFGSL